MIKNKTQLNYKDILLVLLITGTMLITLTIVSYGASAPNASGRISESDGVNVRSSYSTSSSVVCTLPYNATVTISEEKYTVSGSSDKTKIWYYVSSAYGSGYIRSDLTSISYTSGITAKITKEANVRTGPGTTFSTVKKLSKGDSVKVVLKAAASGGSTWYKVNINGSYYYISASYLNLDTGSASNPPDIPSDNKNFEAQLAEFPTSYRAALRALHQKHPTWNFRAKKVGYSWSEALEKQISNVNANLVSISKPDAYKEVRSGTYNFATNTYIGKDGANWVAASKDAVAFYMDPRNWLEESSIFMFEPYTYDASYQKENIVKSILKTTALPSSASAYYVAAAQQVYGGQSYNISPTYLAAKTRIELGSSDFMIDGHSFTYGGKKYSGVYNTYNIGASDSADGSAATKGLVYAAGGSDGSGKSYLRPWNTLEKAVKGGAIYIANNFLDNNQYTAYLSRYNVLNGLGSVGTHQYATSVFSAATESSIMSSCYQDAGVFDEAFTFEIPVYENMPASASPEPGSGNNNNYLDSLKVYEGDTLKSLTATFDRFTSSYKLKTKVSASSVTIKTTTNVNDAKVTVTGNTNLAVGTNKVTVKVTSSSGKVRYYYVTVVREKGDDNAYVPEKPTNVKVQSDSNEQVTLTWNGDAKATGYRVYWKKSGASSWSYNTVKDGTSWTKTMKYRGEIYEYKVAAYYEYKGEKIYSKESDVIKGATFGEANTLTGDLYSGYMTMKFNWDAIDGADGYRLRYKQTTSEKWNSVYVDGNTEVVKKMSYAGKEYEFKLAPYKKINGVRFISNEYSPLITVHTLQKPTVTLKNMYTKSIEVKWTEVGGITGYKVYRSTSKSGTYTLVKTVPAETTRFLNQGRTLGKRYYYKVRAYKDSIYDKTVYGPYSVVVSIKR